MTPLPRRNMSNAPLVLNTADKAMWVTGWNEAIDSLESSLAAELKAMALSEEQSSDAIDLAGHVFSKNDLIRRTMRNMEGTSRWGSPRWVLVKEAFGVGSTVAHALCFEFGLNPDDELRKGRATIFDGAKESIVI